MGIDQFLDMGRTLTNVIGNGIATAVVAKWEGQLQEPRGVDEEDMLLPELSPALLERGIELPR
jgi:Na+/H+-dicarboxylate symporter